ncbi:MAG: tetratricopeptide repeat protein [Desulfobacterales bacterium]|nr:tetratricopeptide repeat protein [Desulfobacterales bacterium]
MKTKLILLIFIFFFASCTSSTQDQQKKTKIAQAIKKEGDAFQSQGDYTAALTKLLEAEKIDPKSPYIQNSLGLAYMGKKRYDMAIPAFDKALSLKPDYTDALNNLGAAYLRQEEWDTAIAKFTLVLDDLIYATPHFPLANIGWAYLGKKNYPKAQSFFLKAIDEKPGFTTAIHGLTQVYIRTGQTDRAISYLHKNLRRTPNVPILHADLAQCYETKGQLRQAVKAWQLVLQLSPENSSLYRKAEERLFEIK